MVHLRILYAKTQHPRPKLWPTGRGQTHTQTEKANTEDPFFRKIFFFDFRFSFKGAVRQNKTKQKIRLIMRLIIQ